MSHRYHGLLWDVPHQAEKRRNGVTGESGNDISDSTLNNSDLAVGNRLLISRPSGQGAGAGEPPGE